MRLAGCLAISTVAAGVAVGGLIVAPTASADCEARNGTMLCTDPPATPNGPSSTVTIPCEYSWYCDQFGLDDALHGNPDPPRPPFGGRPGNRP
jgi:hypothetical protein